MKKFSLVTFLLVLAMITLILPTPARAQDLLTNLDLQYVIVPTTGNTDITSAAISTDNYKTSLLGIYSTANATWSANCRLDVVMTECASSTGTFTPVTAADIKGATPDTNGVILSLDEATTAATLAEIQYVGRMPYFKIKADFVGVATETPTVSVMAVHGGKVISQ